MAAEDPRESKIEDYFIKRVKATGGITFKVKFIGQNGAPDRIALWPGVIIWPEFKKKNKTPCARQLRVHEQLQAAGQDVRIVDSNEQIDLIVEECAMSADIHRITLMERT